MYIALKKQWFDAFAAGVKTTEWRAAGGRFERLRAGARVKLGLGYTGRHHLVEVVRVERVRRAEAPPVVRDYYPDEAEVLAIHVRPISMAAPSSDGPQ